MYSLPTTLQAKIDKLLAHYSLGRLQAAAQSLTRFYAHQSNLPPLRGEELYLAYLAVRLPATYAAVSEVCARLLREQAYTPRTMLDIGAGPGTALLAAQGIFGSLQAVCALERDARFVELGKEFTTDIFPAIEWCRKDMAEEVTQEQTYDCAIASYALGEMESATRKRAVDLLWRSAAHYVIVIEAGTPAGYETVMQARDQLIASGGIVAAPCPHSAPCPLRGSDWCHFSVRLPRSSFHRQMKSGSLGHEDEKFSYVIVSKQAIERPAHARLIRAPCKRSGHMYVTLCTQSGIRQETISRKQKELYTQAKKLEWGDQLLK